MSDIGIAIDGGKDSLSMAARVDNEAVKAPGTLVITSYAPCPDIRKLVTPDMKCPNDKGMLVHVNLSNGKHRLGGTALAHCFYQVGHETPYIENPYTLRDAFIVTQTLIDEGKLTAGHDISDGGFIVCLLEMCFAGNCGVYANVNTKCDLFSTFYNEEVGWIFEVKESDLHTVTNSYKQAGIEINEIGYSCGYGKDARILNIIRN